MINATGYELQPTPWARRAACAGINPDLWFLGKGGNLKPAKTVCDTCPVQAECLAYALAWNIRDGIWGGLSPSQRRPLRTGQRPRRVSAAHGTTTRYARGCRCDGCRQAHGGAKHLRVAP